MLYVVECAYTDPQKRSGVEYLYNREKLPALVSRCPVFTPSQRFCAFSGAALATGPHDIRDAAVLDSDAYRRNGGVILPAGNRRSPTGIATSISYDSRAAEVAPDEVLLLSDTAEALPVAAPIVLQPGVWHPAYPVCRHRPA